MLIELISGQKKNLKLLGSLTAIVFVYESLLALIVFLFDFFPFNKPLVNPFYLLLQWDSWHYLDIAEKGYSLSNANFFPLYPLLIKFFNLFWGNSIQVGFFVSWASLVLALFYFWKLLKRENSIETSKRAILLMLFFPFAVFLSTVYTESLFLFLLISSFYYLKNEKWLTAAALGFFAALTRPVGVFLFPVMLLHYWEIFHSLPFFGSAGRERIKEKLKVLSISFLIPLGAALYFIFCHFELGGAGVFVSQ